MSVTQFYSGFLNSRCSKMCVSIKSLSLPVATPKMNPDHIAKNPYISNRVLKTKQDILLYIKKNFLMKIQNNISLYCLDILFVCFLFPCPLKWQDILGFVLIFLIFEIMKTRDSSKALGLLHSNRACWGMSHF